jgi:hypothetical protein
MPAPIASISDLEAVNSIYWYAVMSSTLQVSPAIYDNRYSIILLGLWLVTLLAGHETHIL